MDMAEPSRTATTLYIAIPAYERKVDVEILTAVAQLPGVYPHVTFALDFIVSSIITNARNYLVRQFLTSDCEWLYFWDADVVIRDMTFLTKLLETAESLGAKIVGGAYRIKSGTKLYAAGMMVDGVVQNFRKEDLNTPRLADVIGTGSMLIHRSVFDVVPSPWFTFVDRADGEVLPEDFHFCMKAKDRGILTAIDPRFPISHFGSSFWHHQLDATAS